MPACPRCSTPPTPGAAFCARCGASLEESSLHQAPTLAPPVATAATGAVHRAAPADPPELVPGSIVAGRYRIVARVGRGGMGEVYRADDLTLGQPVALKFMSPEIAASPTRREWFIREVRIARQITQPNVCRVHDIGFFEPPGGGSGGVGLGKARPFLSMEFVDGEDLAALLRRIGRLPPDKAAQVGAQICAGLAAAHAQGVLHRDLKPANIMLDGRGQVRITDFGLAALTADLKSSDPLLVGTPAYMAPEQLARGELTVRSDIYALGLVLYELFTGERAVRGENVADITAQVGARDFALPSTRVMGIDPAVETVIMRCLEPRPEDRPASVAVVAAALPGGEPLDHILAAGQTPDPSVLAASGSSGRIGPAAAAAWFIACLLGVLAVSWLNRSVSLLGVLGGGKPPEVLIERCEELARSFGYPDASGRSGVRWGWRQDEELFDSIELDTDVTQPPGWWSIFTEPGSRLAPLEFWYRRAPERIDPLPRQWAVLPDSPGPSPGEVQIGLDARGRLIRFAAAPLVESADETEDAPAPGPVAAPWPALLGAAGLSESDLTPVTPGDAAVTGDAHAAWTMTVAGGPMEGKVARIEAAALRGRPVLLRIIWPWGLAHREEPLDPALEWFAAIVFLTPLIVTPMVVGAVMARRNWLAGRGDRRGALRVGGAVLLFESLAWVLSADHPGVLAGFDNMTAAFGMAMASAGLVWMMYLAIEPAVRRRRPSVLVSWTRLTSGRWSDPMVGRDVLRGAAIGAGWAAVYKLWVLIASRLPDAPAPTLCESQALRGVPSAIAVIVDGLSGSAQYGLLMLVALLLIGRPGRRPAHRWLARIGFGVFVFLLGVVILPLLGQQQATNSVRYLYPFGMVTAAGFFFVLARLGLVCVIVATTVIWTLFSLPVTLDPSVWYGPMGVTAVAPTLLAAAWGGWTAAAGAPERPAPRAAPSLSNAQRPASL